jgi:hypothetical protein
MFSLANKTDSGPLGRCLCATEDWVYEAGFGDFTHAHALKATLLRS